VKIFYLDRLGSLARINIAYTQSVGLLGRGISHVVRPLPTQDNTNRTNVLKKPCLEWDEPTIPAFEWAKTFHALDSAATVIGTDIRATGSIDRTEGEFSRTTSMRFNKFCTHYNRSSKHILQKREAAEFV
jgi:hypothetical protein